MAGRYSRVQRGTWNDERFRRLSPIKPCGAGLFLFLLVNERQSSLPGLQAWGERALAEKLRWPLRSFRKVWHELAAEDMAQADWGAGVVCLPKAIDHDPPQSPNVIRAWGTWYRELPECELCRDHLVRLARYVQPMSEGFRKAFTEAFAKAFAKGFVEGWRIPTPDPSPVPVPVPVPKQQPRRHAAAKPKSKPTSQRAVLFDSEVVFDIMAHHAACFGRSWAYTKQQVPLGDLRRRMRTALELVGREGVEQAHLGHRLQCKANPKRGSQLRHAYPQLENDGKLQSNKLDPARYMEQVQAGIDYMSNERRRINADAKLDKERDRMVAEAEAADPNFDPNKLPAWLRESYERGKAGRKVKEEQDGQEA